MIPAYYLALLAVLCTVTLAQLEPIPENLESSDADEDKRTPLGTMRFGKRAILESADDDFLDDKLSFNIFDGLLREARSPLGTMRFGKRSGGDKGTMRFGKRGDPLHTMRFGKRQQNPFSWCVMKNLSWRPMLACRNTMRFGKRDPLGTMRFGRK
ncbi:unnamed protein product, partial [Mesorhabditis belari]|uniref:Uncharacterized protein n=1 Tax=Mesorhabditis belari TaxID=2138241 RepID=A0AAF3FKP6_9BILA